MNKTIATLIIELSNLTCNIHSTPFSSRLASIQDALGQDDGGFAGHFFFEHKDLWGKYTTEEKRNLLTDYVREELEGLISNDME